MTGHEFIVVLVTAPDEATAASIAKKLVEKRLAACVNITSEIRSIYRWQGKIEDDSEALMLIKTRQLLFAALAKTIKQLHPYKVPEIIALPVVEGSADYTDWIRDVTTEEIP